MSLFGKFLLVLNILGAAALGYFAIVDHGRRQAWSQVSLTYDFMQEGLPVDKGHLDKQGHPLHERLTGPVTAHLFSGVGGNPVPTQLDEVDRVKGLIDVKLKPTEADPRHNAHELAGILLPFAETGQERDQFLAARIHLASNEARDALKARYGRAKARALEIMDNEAKEAGAGGKPRLVDAAFRQGFRDQLGLPSEWITTAIVRGLPADAAGLRATDVGTLFDAALAEQRTQFEARLKGLFAAARATPDSPAADRRAPIDTQRANIARLLFGLTLALSNEPAEAPGKAQRALMGRVYVVCGLQAGVDAVSERSAILRQLAERADSSSAQERQEFLAELDHLLNAAREQAFRVTEEARSVAENKRKLAEQEEVVKLRDKDVDDAKAELAALLVKTAEQLRALKALSALLLRERLESRDQIATMQQKEKEIRELEKQVRELQKKAR